MKRAYDDDTTYAMFIENEKKWLVNDKTGVRKIDSVYRDRDAGLASKGLAKLEMVMKGAVVPTYSMQKHKAT